MSQLELYLNLQNIKNRNIKMYVQKTKTFIYLRAIFRFLFLPNLQRLNKITKSVKSINLRIN